jgi:hypothetical protein
MGPTEDPYLQQLLFYHNWLPVSIPWRLQKKSPRLARRKAGQPGSSESYGKGYNLYGLP